MKKYYLPLFIIFIAVILVVGFFWLRPSSKISSPTETLGELNEKIYVAVEGESKVAVIDPNKKKVIGNINLSKLHDGEYLNYAPHNVQVSPDMKTVWVTVNIPHKENHSFRFIPYIFAHEVGGEEPDEVVVIDAIEDKIIKRIPIAPGIHLAHIVLTPDNSFAYVTAQEEGALYRINAKTFEVEKRIAFPKNSQPHGIRISPDGKFAYIAMLERKSLGILDLFSYDFSEIPLDGKAVQAGITPDNKYAMASLYDTEALALYNLVSKELNIIKLPESAKGPIQMYPTPDSKFIYLADQGYYFGKSEGSKVYKIDVDKKEVVKEIEAGRGPHGVAISSDGERVYVTNLLSGDVSIIDANVDLEIARIKVGKEPNGISVWENMAF
jgi:YVTN family beta-propeller protein